jgi:hypothetical protein
VIAAVARFCPEAVLDEILAQVNARDAAGEYERMLRSI